MYALNISKKLHQNIFYEIDGGYSNGANSKNVGEKFEWTDELLQLAFGKGKFIENKHGVILYQVGNTIYIVDESQNLYYGETSVKTDWAYAGHKSSSGKIQILHGSGPFESHKIEFTLGKGTKLQKIEEHFQEKRNVVNKAQEQTRIRASLGSIIGSGVAIPASANNVQIQGEEMQYIQQIYDMRLDIGGGETSIRELLVEIDRKPDNVITLRNTIAFLKKTEPFSHFPGIFEYFEVIIQDKVNQVELTRGYTRIDEIEKLTGDDTLTIATLFSLSRELSIWLEARAKNPLPTGEKEREASVLLDALQKRIEKMKSSEKDSVVQAFEAFENEIAEYLVNVIYIEHIAQIYNEPSYKGATELLGLLPDDIAKEKRGVLARLINERRNTLEKEKEEKSKKLVETRVALLRDIRSNMSELSDLVKSLESEGDVLSAKRENGLVKATEDIIWQLGAEETEKLYKELMDIFDERIASLKLTESVFQRSGGKIDLGNESYASVYEPEKTGIVTWEMVGKKSGDEIIISFHNSVGGTIEPSIAQQYRKNNPLAVNKSDFAQLQEYLKRWNTRYKKEFFTALYELKKSEVDVNMYPEDISKKENLEKMRSNYEKLASKSYLARMFHLLPKHNLSSRPLVPHLYPGTVIGPTTEAFLQNFADLAEKQIESQGKGSGIIIIEGDAGTGKNFKIDIYAHMTNREVFEMQGNKTAQKEDILYSYELGPDGTYRLPSHLIRGIQTPGSVIVLDEVNTYPPEVLKLLNPLLDGRRYINDPQFGKIQVHPSVLLVGLMNPQHYLGTTPLSPEVKSRARMMKDSYPALKLSDGTISWEEAYLITRHMSRVELIKKMDQNTFISFWNASVNNMNMGFQPTEKAKKIFEDVAGYISFANALRNVYQKTMMGSGSEEFHYPISLREGIQVIEEYERNGYDMKQAVRDVVIPKISGKNVDVGAEIKVLESRLSKI
ncbi:AAA family ATPase [Candidatus Gracilibacteria bacterium]|nr:AAA family ATPase [Candidatus Gracilibacteria bacterium]